ncbi:hypothetical protein DPMN_162775 [Dreissena polymorpha]|uniref:Uncharacterized protein n=1 Tax=Dreissena polymorpha TaxID=45954 RepID=A0A9D4IS97_DREPO|nr:hypothetical protein DPMN_162775 [Dreissena polymorpha]
MQERVLQQSRATTANKTNEPNKKLFCRERCEVPDHHEYTQIKIRDDPWTGWFLSDKGFTKIITSVTTRHPNRPHVQTRTARQHYAINTEQHGRHLPSADETLCPGRMT